MFALNRRRLPALPWLLAGLAALLALPSLWLLAQRPSAEAALVREAVARRQLSGTDQLLFAYREQVDRAPDDLDAAATLGELYLQKARESGDPAFYSQAEAQFAAVLRRDPANLGGLVGKGSLLLSQHRFAEALAVGEAARERYPYVARVYGVIGDALVELGRYDEAVAAVQQMVDIRPDLASYSRVAYLRELYGDTDGAIEAMQMAVEARGPTTENTEWTRVQLGHLFFGRGDLAAAEAAYAQSLAAMPGYVHALAGLARVRAAQGQTDEAVELYGQAVSLMPLPEFLIALGELHEARGDQAAAAEQYALVEGIQRLFAAQGADVDLELALFQADHGDPAEALRLARAAYADRPGIRAAEALAWALHKGGSHAEARAAIEEALGLGTRDATLLYRAGMIAAAQGDAAAARGYLAGALALNPAFSPLHAPIARATLERLP